MTINTHEHRNIHEVDEITHIGDDDSKLIAKAITRSAKDIINALIRIDHKLNKISDTLSYPNRNPL